MYIYDTYHLVYVVDIEGTDFRCNQVDSCTLERD